MECGKYEDSFVVYVFVVGEIVSKEIVVFICVYGYVGCDFV